MDKKQQFLPKMVKAPFNNPNKIKTTKLKYFGTILDKDEILEKNVNSYNKEYAWVLPFLNANSANGQVALYITQDEGLMMAKVQLDDKADLLLNDYIVLNKIWDSIKEYNSTSYFENVIMNPIKQFFFVPIVYYTNNKLRTAIDFLKFLEIKYNTFPCITFKPIASPVSFDKKLIYLFTKTDIFNENIQKIQQYVLNMSNSDNDQYNVFENLHREFQDFFDLFDIDVYALHDIDHLNPDEIESNLLQQLDGQINHYFTELNELYKKLIYLGMIILPGFAHNDFHSYNVIYDDEKQSFCVIDFGRATYPKKSNEPTEASRKEVTDGILKWNELRKEQLLMYNISLNDCETSVSEKCINYVKELEQELKDHDETNEIIDKVLLINDFSTKKSTGGVDNIWGDLAGLMFFCYHKHCLPDELEIFLEDIYNKNITQLQDIWKTLSDKNDENYLYLKLSCIWIITYIKMNQNQLQSSENVSIDDIMYSYGQLKANLYDKIEDEFGVPAILNILDPNFKEKVWYKSLAPQTGGYDTRTRRRKHKKPRKNKTSFEESAEKWRQVYETKLSKL